jgi:hypothetical protein
MHIVCKLCGRALSYYPEAGPSNGFAYQRPTTKVPEHKNKDGKRCKNSRKPLEINR